MILGLTVQVASDIVKACGIKNKNQDNLDHVSIVCVHVCVRACVPDLVLKGN